jgi:hypothetical protein
VTLISEFFQDIDALWSPTSNPRIRLRLIGSTALMLRTTYERGTKDSDVLETVSLDDATKGRLLDIAGRGTALSKRHRLYLDIVSRGLPFLPRPPVVHLHAELNATLSSFEIEVLDVVDVVVSKMKRFHGDDVDDIMAMIDLQRVTHSALVDRFRSAVDAFSGDARAEDLPRYVANLHRIERDGFDAPPTSIELPDWI